MTCDVTIEPISEDALLLRFGDSIDTAINARVHAAARALRAAALPGVIDIAPAYASLLLRFEMPRMGSDSSSIIDAVRAKISREFATCLPLPQAASSPGGEGWGEGANASQTRQSDELIEIPVCYGGEFGPDLAAVVAHTGLSHDEVIAHHAAGEYTVAMLGFAPGFPYLLGLDAALHIPRRASPRTRVPMGSVAIGGGQTGIYPSELPGGWNLIGRTPLVLFDPAREHPTLLTAGDRVRFRAVDADEFAALQARKA